jgi:PEP-CTERM motif-containing protein
MARSYGRGSLVAVVAGLVLLAAPFPALADFAVRIQGPDGFDQTVSDNGPRDTFVDPLANPHAIGTSSLIEGSILSINAAITNTPGGPPSSFLSLNWFLSSSLVAPTGPVTVTASATGYTFPLSGVSSVLRSDVGGILGGTASVTAQQWVDLGDGLFAVVGPTPGAQGPFSTPPTFSDTKYIGFISATFYSITDKVILTLGPSSLTSGTLTSTVVPEPITMFLGGTGVLMLGYAARRRLFGR